jgi:diacylglycerol kinase family enzyme
MEREIWLVNNASSGSNDDGALARARRVLRRTMACASCTARCFPRRTCRHRRSSTLQGSTSSRCFAGDGTINSLIGALAGWSGAALVLPGGTMNLLYHRLHGERTMEEVIAAVARGESACARRA